MESAVDRLQRLQENLTLYGQDMIMGLVIVILGLLLVKWITRGVRRLLMRMTGRVALVATISNVIGLLLLVVVIIGAASEAGLPIRPVFRLMMIVTLCAVGLIVFFRPYIPSLPFKVGQTIKAGDLLGKVEAITMINTRLRTFDGKTFFLPNKKILSDILVNYHYTPTRRFKLNIPIRYDQDLMKGKQVLEEIMIADPRVLAKPAPVVYLFNLDNGCMMLGGRGWVDNLKYWVTKCDLIEKVKLRFDREGLVISYPHTAVHHYQEGGPTAGVYGADTTPRIVTAGSDTEET